ncbi:MAG: insulinase family protein [Xanthomonadales bacterium]|nr:insulinase family protein [Xanthomonadales bacterium]
MGDFDPDEYARVSSNRCSATSSPKITFERYERAFHRAEPAALEVQMDDKANAGLLGQLTIEMSDKHPDYPAMKLASHLLGGGFLSSRLANRIRDEEGLSYGVGGGFNASSIDKRGSFYTYAMYAPQNRDELVDVLFEELNKAVDEGFDEEEVAEGRRGYLRQLELMRSNDAQLINLLGNNLYLDRDMFHQAEFEQKVAELSADDVTQAVREHLDPELLSYAVAGDFEEDPDESPDESPDDESGD